MFEDLIRLDSGESLSLISSGDQAAQYVEQVRDFSWRDFFENHYGGAVFLLYVEGFQPSEK